jgi:hypothetical protein
VTNDTFTVRSVVLGLVVVVVAIVVSLVVVLVAVTLTPEQTGAIISGLAGIGTTALGALAALLAHTVTGSSSISVTPAAPSAQAVTVTDEPPAVTRELGAVVEPGQ